MGYYVNRYATLYPWLVVAAGPNMYSRYEHTVTESQIRSELLAPGRPEGKGVLRLRLLCWSIAYIPEHSEELDVTLRSARASFPHPHK